MTEEIEGEPCSSDNWSRRSVSTTVGAVLHYSVSHPLDVTVAGNTNQARLHVRLSHHGRLKICQSIPPKQSKIGALFPSHRPISAPPYSYQLQCLRHIHFYHHARGKNNSAVLDFIRSNKKDTNNQSYSIPYICILLSEILSETQRGQLTPEFCISTFLARCSARSRQDNNNEPRPPPRSKRLLSLISLRFEYLIQLLGLLLLFTHSVHF